MSTKFNDLPWHDASLLFFSINRQHPGEQDTIELLINWPDSNEFSIIKFFDCYALVANMNFGIIAPDSILQAECIIENEEINSIQSQWSTVGVDINGLKCFRIETNSTNSVLKIFSLGFVIQKADVRDSL